MPDYITRQEFEEAINALRCVGDQQTINVQQTPGGQVIESMQVITADDVAQEYVSVTYDSVAEEFTVTVTDLPYIWLNSGEVGSSALDESNAPKAAMPFSTNYYTIDQTFTFDKPVSDVALTLLIGDNIFSNAADKPLIYWFAGATLVASDSATEIREYGVLRGMTEFASMTLKSDGSVSINYIVDDKFTITCGRVPTQPSLFIDRATKTLSLVSVDPLQVTSAATQKDYVYTNPVTDTIILGFTYGDSSMTLDISANSGSYTKSVQIGYINVDASNVVQQLSYYGVSTAMATPPFGYSGSFTDHDSNTITVRNGIITNKA